MMAPMATPTPTLNSMLFFFSAACRSSAAVVSSSSSASAMLLPGLPPSLGGAIVLVLKLRHFYCGGKCNEQVAGIYRKGSAAAGRRHGHPDPGGKPDAGGF